MNKRVVLFDADGFLLDFMTPALSVVNKLLGTTYTADSFPTWNIFDTIGKEHEGACYIEYEKPGFCAAFKPYPDAVEGVREAKKMVDVGIVTSPIHSPTWCFERRQSLEQHFGILHKDVIFAQRKALVKGHMLVDDRPSNAEDWAQAHPQGVGVIWTQPNNKIHVIKDDASNVVRCNTWFGSGGLLDMIEQVARGEDS